MDVYTTLYESKGAGPGGCMNNEQFKLGFHNGFHLPKIDMGIKHDIVFDEDFGFYTEDYFREMLANERKRTERSQNPILLVMLDIEKLLDSLPRKNIVKHISSVLTDSAREIDIKGWYKYDKSIGIIYTEIHKSGKVPILEKVHVNLALALGRDNAEKVEVTFAVFPLDDTAGESGTSLSVDTRFYPSPFTSSSSKRVSVLVKRAEDIILSGFFIVLFLPLFIAIAALIKLTSKGPVFFLQKRIGLEGKPFLFIKFRSMHTDNDPSIHKEFVKNLISGKQENTGSGNNGVYKIKDDPRVTRIGKFIRKTSLDELPQLFNVLLGHMSLVGPRPPIPYEIENYNIWHLRRVLEIKPGITGYWQVTGRSATTFDTMVRMDLRYIMRWTLWWDFKLMLRTPLAVFKGAY
jgi:lipopolysaccharide/colanic/teichoic acid biosynthesis glycosyltransferase